MKNTIKLSAIALIGLSSLASCKKSANTQDKDSKKLEGSITISGAFALYPLVNVWAEEFIKENPDVRINVSGGGAGKGMADVLSGTAEIGMFSKEISEEEKAQGIWWVSVTKDAVIPTLSAANPLLEQLKKEGVKQSDLKDFFIDAKNLKWKGSQNKVNVYTRSDAAGAADVWAKYLGAKAQEDLKGVAVFGDPGLADAVKKDPLGIGYNNVIYAYDVKTGKKYDGLEVLPIDVNGNGQIDKEEDFYNNLGEITAAIADGRYPSPPARELYLITKGKPTDPIVLAFLNWILEKGQASVEPNGYILLKKDVLEAQKQKIK
jgi:phosphate transport system substrate-binding protein